MSRAPLIIVRQGPAGWTADMSDTPQAAEMRRLFGTTSAPTGYTREATAEQVAEGIGQRNPTCIVVAFPQGADDAYIRAYNRIPKPTDQPKG